MLAEQRRWFGTAEDGASVRINAAVHRRAGLEEHWPPTGLIRDDASRRNGDGATERVLDLDEDADGIDGFRLVENGQTLGSGWVRVESTLGLFAAEHLSGRVAVHAGIVRWRGHTIVLPGSSFAGKTTLCLALAAAGADLLSDEYAVIDPTTGGASGWPRPVHLRRPDGTVARIPLRPPPGDPSPVRLVAALRYEPGRPARFQSVSRAVGARILMANTVGARRSPEEAFAAATAVARGAEVISGIRHDAAEAAVELIERCELDPGSVGRGP